ncbi:MAG: hypothetical protein JW795_23940 [Chitinivibrionales bacterium]|nr:hypothetical protein [Chitinivibrionales bacterium]
MKVKLFGPFFPLAVSCILFNTIPLRAQQSPTVHKPWYTFDEIGKICSGYAVKYPSLVRFDTIGYSLKKRVIWRVRINCIADTTPRQRFFFDGATHGNEKIGTEICMRIMKELVEKHETDQKIKTLLGYSEFVFIPIINPDGFMSNKRSLDNGKDADRAGAFKLGGKDSDGSLPNQWPELKAMYLMHVEAPTYFGCDYHCGTKDFLFPFFANKLSGKIPDIELCNNLKKFYPIAIHEPQEYAAHDQEEDGLRGGGITNDLAYAKNGSMSFMPEVCAHNPPENTIDGITQSNLDNVLAVINEMQKGVCGVIRDASSKAPLYGRVSVKNNGAPVFSSPFSGAFYKYIPSASGTLEVTVFSNGYKAQTKTMTAVTGGFAKLDFDMEYDKTLPYHGMSVEMMGVGNSMAFEEILACLEKPDGKGTVVNNGFIVIDLGPKTYATNHPENDITVEATGSDKYTVSISNDPMEIVDNGKNLGEGSGKTSFDMAKAGIDKARYIRIDATGAVTVDAVAALPNDLNTSIHEQKAFAHADRNLRAYKTAAGITFHGFIPQGAFRLAIFDMRGRCIATVANEHSYTAGGQMFTWNGLDSRGQRCGSGTYALSITTKTGCHSLKFPVTW